jgi:hypothetical protein
MTLWAGGAAFIFFFLSGKRANNAIATLYRGPRDEGTIGDRRGVFCYFVRLAIDQTCLTLTSSTGILSLMNSWDRLVAVRCS